MMIGAMNLPRDQEWHAAEKANNIANMTCLDMKGIF